MSWLTVATRGSTGFRGLVSTVPARGATPNPGVQPVPPAVAIAPSLSPPGDDKPPGDTIEGLPTETDEIEGLTTNPDTGTDDIEGLAAATASEINHYLTTPSTHYGPAPPPPAFSSPEFDALLTRMTTLAQESTARWKIMDKRHENDIAKFSSLNESVIGQNQLTASMAEQVKGLRLSADNIQSVAQEALDIASATRTKFNQFVTTAVNDPINTSTIDAAFADADNALRSGLAGLESEVSSHMDRADHPCPPPTFFRG